MKVESLFRVIAKHDAHNAGDDRQYARLDREILVGRLGDGCSVRHEEARNGDHEKLTAEFLLNANG